MTWTTNASALYRKLPAKQACEAIEPESVCSCGHIRQTHEADGTYCNGYVYDVDDGVRTAYSCGCVEFELYLPK